MPDAGPIGRGETKYFETAILIPPDCESLDLYIKRCREMPDRSPISPVGPGRCLRDA